MEEALAAHAPTLASAYRPVDVLVELGGPAGAPARATPTRPSRSPGPSPRPRTCGWSGSPATRARWPTTATPTSLAVVRDFLTSLRELHRSRRRGSVPARSWCRSSQPAAAPTSTTSPRCSDRCWPQGVRVVLRSGAYLTHDDGHYRHLSPLGEHPAHRGVPAGQRDARLGAGDVSQPEPGLALFDARQARPAVRPGPARGPAAASCATGIGRRSRCHRSDGHRPQRPARLPPLGSAAAAPIMIGDELRLGVSHPCTAFDKWKADPGGRRPGCRRPGGGRPGPDLLLSRADAGTIC